MPIVLVGSSSVTTVGFKDGLVNKIRQRDVTLYIEHQKKNIYIGNNWTVIKHFFVKLQLAVTLYLLYSQVGVAFLAGLVFSVVLIPINKLIANKIGDLSTKLMEQKDKRVKIITEVLRGIKAVKLYVWEDHFLRLISRTYARHFNPIRFVIKNDIYRFKPSGYYTSPLELIGISLVLLFQTWNIEIIFFLMIFAGVRNQELKYLKGRKYLDALCVYFWATTPVVICILTFTTYSLLGNQLTAATVFTAMALLNMLISPLNAFPWVLNGMMEAWVSVKRIQKLLQVNWIIY